MLVLLWCRKTVFEIKLIRGKMMEKRVSKNIYTWVGCFLFGGYGVNWFMRGKVGLGILKIITFGGVGVWSLIDWIIALTKLGNYDAEFVFIDGNWEK